MTTHRPRTLVTVALTATGLLLTGCSSSSPTHANTVAAQTGSTTGAAANAPTSTAGTPSAAPAPTAQAGVAAACDLITEAEATAALGADPGPGSKFASHGSSQCQFGSYQAQFLLVNITPTRGKAGYDLMHNNPKLSQAGSVANLAGVGDRAFEITGPGTASIYFNKGDALILVSVAIPSAPVAPKAQALALAKTAADRV